MQNIVYKQVYNDKDGNEKVYWNKCGRVIETQKGTFLKLDHIPVGFNGWFSLFEEEPKKDSSWEQQREKFAVKKEVLPTDEEVDEPIDLSEIPF